MNKYLQPVVSVGFLFTLTSQEGLIKWATTAVLYVLFQGYVKLLIRKYPLRFIFYKLVGIF